MRSLRIGLGAAAYCAGIGITYEFSQPKPSLPTAAQRCCTFENLAPEYDTEVEHDETAAGILAMRAELAASARGKVLEIAAGTGRNLPFYKREQVEALVISDYSEQMLTVAARKVAQLRDIEKHAMPSAITLAVMDAAALPFADSTYDTIVDSFGLCSFEEPQSVLREMARCCKVGGNVLLLEHGESWLPPLRWWQRHRLNRHVCRYGCYWNRDIQRLVGESELKIVEMKRCHFGTTYYIRCVKVNK
mmetsp:Transcript_35589/g.58983  ORF Transcript_35589/g.58983 Transcript_35589/m.58983 type:complete len:247 (-) Transcript_35589:212-952(-)